MATNARPSNRVHPRIIFALTIAAILLTSLFAHARDDGRYAGSPLKPWFDQLKSKLGACCSDADGTAVSDADWESNDGHFRVRLGDVWMDVPDSAVITGPNLAGRTMVWPTRRQRGDARDFLGPNPPYGPEDWYVRCFIPGQMT